MRRRILGVAAAAIAGFAGVAVSPVAAQAAVSCGAPNYTANWVGVTCSGSGSFRVGATCLILGSGGQSYLQWGGWKAAPTTNYANCRSGTAPLAGSARLQTR
ncbi:hypothetical protein Q0Z83_046360 [Actinoplanes sichuanensis]|uniref:Uncharacterized protein n=1 Tax=Actinoplanes sichuanensis TaxID=512349 RepID=A0ABW4AAL9_9ACTN|nr:hypothetical protein [Actinoplanes sichuanensis]BEL06445.1 hypothetical protein Q0Z83_046360 [Actinoplanes sichuanensis]